MEYSRITALPTRLNAEAAWEEHRALVMQADADKSLWADIDHCMKMARAYQRWQTLFLAMDDAA